MRIHARRLSSLKLTGVDAEDIEQELGYELLKAMKRFDPHKGNLSAFANGVLSRKYKSYLREHFAKKKGRAIFFESIERQRKNDIADVRSGHLKEELILKIDLSRSINRLSIFHIQLCELLQHYSVSEIAKLLKISYSSLHCEIRKIRKKLSEEFNRDVF